MSTTTSRHMCARGPPLADLFSSSLLRRRANFFTPALCRARTMIFNVPLPSTALAPSSAGAPMMEKRKARAARGKELFYRDSSRVPSIIWSARVLTRHRDSRFLPLSLVHVLPVDLRPRRCFSRRAARQSSIRRFCVCDEHKAARESPQPRLETPKRTFSMLTSNGRLSESWHTRDRRGAPTCREPLR